MTNAAGYEEEREREWERAERGGVGGRRVKYGKQQQLCLSVAPGQWR